MLYYPDMYPQTHTLIQIEGFSLSATSQVTLSFKPRLLRISTPGQVYRPFHSLLTSRVSRRYYGLSPFRPIRTIGWLSSIATRRLVLDAMVSCAFMGIKSLQIVSHLMTPLGNYSTKARTTGSPLSLRIFNNNDCHFYHMFPPRAV